MGADESEREVAVEGLYHDDDQVAIAACEALREQLMNETAPAAEWTLRVADELEAAGHAERAKAVRTIGETCFHFRANQPGQRRIRDDLRAKGDEQQG